MKTLLFVMLVGLYAGTANSQDFSMAKQNVSAAKSKIHISNDSNLEQRALATVDRYKKRRNTGRVLAIAGGGLMVAGITLIATSDTDSGLFGSLNTQSIIGSVGLVAGASSAAVGIPMWISNNKKMKQAEGGVSLGLTNSGNIGLTYKF